MIQVKETCISCGSCAAVCPSRILVLNSEGHPEATANYCITCGQCEAVCPTNSLTNDLLSAYPNDRLSLDSTPAFTPQQSELFLRSRRSIRYFSKDLPTREDSEKLVNIGRFTQTSGNSQGVSFLVIEKPEIMQSLREQTLDFYNDDQNQELRAMHAAFMNPNDDLLMRGAPMLIMALGSTDNPFAKDTAQFALTYLELHAHSLGLGTCWAGFLERYLMQNSPELRDLLQLEEGIVPCKALLYGKPQHQFHHTTRRKPLDIQWR